MQVSCAIQLASSFAIDGSIYYVQLRNNKLVKVLKLEAA